MVEFGNIIVEDASDNLSHAVIQHGDYSLHTLTEQTERDGKIFKEHKGGLGL